PYNVVSGSQPKVSVTFYYDDESDAGPYPFDVSQSIENGSDAHLLALDSDNCILYETWDTSYANGNWSAGSGAIFDLNSNDLRTLGWTSADAAGFAIMPGLVKYEEVKSGVINHAIRFTASRTDGTYIWPASHKVSVTGSGYPPMGQRFRLKANYDISGFSEDAQVILTAALIQYKTTNIKVPFFS
ncbi:hypothetical protein MCHI_002724, partial [Candidatus Magnetoovum chiemensis]